MLVVQFLYQLCTGCKTAVTVLGLGLDLPLCCEGLGAGRDARLKWLTIQNLCGGVTDEVWGVALLQ